MQGVGCHLFFHDGSMQMLRESMQVRPTQLLLVHGEVTTAGQLNVMYSGYTVQNPGSLNPSRSLPCWHGLWLILVLDVALSRK